MAKYFNCPRQSAVVKSVRENLENYQLVMINGQVLSGKTYIAKKLASTVIAPGYASVFIGSYAGLIYPSAQHTIACAMGLPTAVADLHHNAFLTVLQDVFRHKAKVILYVDDIDMLFGGSKTRYDEYVFILRSLISAIPALSIVGTFSEGRTIPPFYETLQLSNILMVSIEKWSSCEEFSAFSHQVARALGLQHRASLEEDFLSQLLARTEGATGRVIKTFYALGARAKAGGNRIFCRNDLDKLWR